MKPEREVWILLLGACLGGGAARKESLDGLSDSDPPDEDLRCLMVALRDYDGKDGGKVQLSLERFGVTVNGKLLASVKEKCRLLSRERKIKEQVVKVSAARVNDKEFWEQVEQLKKVLG